MGDVGHTAVIGPTGSGKSVFLAMIYTQWLKYKNARVFIFDKGASSKVPTYCNGGIFYNLGIDAITFQPLRRVGLLENEELEEAKTRINTEIEWCFSWILDIFIQENLILTPRQKDKVWEALELISNSDVSHRTLTTFATFLADPDLREALNPYLITGAMGKYFDANDENIQSSDWNVFEMNQILQNKNISSITNVSLPYNRTTIKRRANTNCFR